MFQGRFKAVLVEDDSHAQEMTGYVYVNPVRASIVERPEEQGWSSYRDYVAVGTAPGWLDCETVLVALGKNRSSARPAYRCFVEAGLSEPSRSPLERAVGGMFLGSGEWIDGWRRQLSAESVREGVSLQPELAWRPILEHVVGAASEAFGVEPTELRVTRRHGNKSRPAAICLARHQTDTGVRANRAHFGGVSPAAISKALARAETRRAEDRVWDLRLAELSERVRTSGNCPKESNVKTCPRILRMAAFLPRGAAIAGVAAVSPDADTAVHRPPAWENAADASARKRRGPWQDRLLVVDVLNRRIAKCRILYRTGSWTAQTPLRATA